MLHLSRNEVLPTIFIENKHPNFTQKPTVQNHSIIREPVEISGWIRHLVSSKKKIAAAYTPLLPAIILLPPVLHLRLSRRQKHRVINSLYAPRCCKHQERKREKRSRRRRRRRMQPGWEEEEEEVNVRR